MPYLKRKANGQEVLKPVALVSAEGWVAEFSSGQKLPLVAWALLPDGEMVGLIENGPEFLSAEQMLNFSSFRRPR